MRYILACTAVIDSCEKRDVFSEDLDLPDSREKTIKTLLFGRKDGLFLHTSAQIADLTSAGHLLPPQGVSEWASQLLVKIDMPVPSTGHTLLPILPSTAEVYPFVAATFIKFKDHALEAMAPLGSATTRSLLAQAIAQRLARGYEACNRSYGANAKRRFSCGLYYSYGGSEDLAVIGFSSSLALVSEMVGSMRRLSVEHLNACSPGVDQLFQQSRVDHIVRDTSTLSGICWRPAQNGSAAMQNLVPKIADAEHTHCYWSFAAKPGHVTAALRSLPKPMAASISPQAPHEAFNACFRKHNVVCSKSWPIDQFLASMAAVYEPDSEAFCSHIRRTSTRIMVDLRASDAHRTHLCAGNAEALHRVDTPLRMITQGLKPTVSTARALEYTIGKILRLCRDKGYHNLFSYLELGCYDLIGNICSYLASTPAPSDIHDAIIQEELVTWIEQMNLCYRDRYRVAAPVSEVSTVPVIVYQGSYQRTLMVCDYLSNVFLKIMSNNDAVRTCAIQWPEPNAKRAEALFHPAIISYFGISDAPSLIPVTSLSACFLNVGWRITFAPTSLFYLAHEAANALMSTHFDHILRLSEEIRFGTTDIFHDSLVVDTAADWLAVSVLGPATPNLIAAYFQSIANIVDVFAEAAKPSEFSLRAIAHFAWRHESLMRLAASPIGPVRFAETVLSVAADSDITAIVSRYLRAIDRSAILNSPQLKIRLAELSATEAIVQGSSGALDHVDFWDALAVAGSTIASDWMSAGPGVTTGTRTILQALNTFVQTPAQARTPEVVADFMTLAGLQSQLEAPDVLLAKEHWHRHDIDALYP